MVGNGSHGMRAMNGSNEHVLSHHDRTYHCTPRHAMRDNFLSRGYARPLISCQHTPRRAMKRHAALRLPTPRHIMHHEAKTCQATHSGQAHVLLRNTKPTMPSPSHVSREYTGPSNPVRGGNLIVCGRAREKTM